MEHKLMEQLAINDILDLKKYGMWLTKMGNKLAH